MKSFLCERTWQLRGRRYTDRPSQPVCSCPCAHLDIRIWSFENILQQWNFYQIRPDVPKKPDVAKKHQETVVYLKLTRKHYEWLRPSQEIPAELELQWPQRRETLASIPQLRRGRKVQSAAAAITR